MKRHLLSNVPSQGGDEKRRPMRLAAPVRHLLKVGGIRQTVAVSEIDPAQPGGLDMALRMDEMVETVLEIINAAFAQVGDDDALASAEEAFALIAGEWPENRRRMMEQVFKDIVRYRSQLQANDEMQLLRQNQMQAMQARLGRVAREALEAARSGHVKTLAVQMQRLLTLRDFSVSAGVLDAELMDSLTECFAVDLAIEQIRGEIQRIAKRDPLEAVSQAVTFQPQVPDCYVLPLVKAARAEAEACLEHAVLQMRGERRLEHMKARMAAVGCIGRMISSYVLGQPLQADGAFYHDPYVQAFRTVIVKAAARRGLHADDPDTVTILTTMGADRPLPWRLLVILRAAASGHLSWQSAVQLCGTVIAPASNVAIDVA